MGSILVACVPVCLPPEICTLPEPWPPAGGTVTPPDPTKLSISCPTIPSTSVVGTPVTIQVLGQNFTASCVAFVDNVAQPTTFVSATELTFTSTGTTARSSTVTVRDGGTTATGGPCTFTWTAAPILTVRCPLVPATAACGAPALTVLVNGSLFSPTTEVLLDGTAQPTTMISATQVSFTIDPTLEFAPRIAQVTARDGAATAAVSCPFEFTQTLIVPTITSVLPDMIGLDDPTPKLITVAGTGFDATSTITLNFFDDIPTTFVNATTLTATPNPTTNGTASIRVMNGGVRTNQSLTSVAFMVVLNPVLNSLVPPSVPIGGADIALKILGANFGNTAKILLDGVEVPTTINSSGSITTTISPSAETAPRAMEVTVRLGHDPAHIDDILPVGPPLIFQFT